MKSKKQNKRTRKYKRVKTRKIKGGALLYKNGKWVALVNQIAIQNENVRLYRESEARMMNLLKIPYGPLKTILSDIPYVIGFFNSVDYYVKRRILANLTMAIDYREAMHYQDKPHKDFLAILNVLRDDLSGIFYTITAPAVNEEPLWHIDELKEKIVNLKEQEEFLQQEIDKGDEQTNYAIYIDKLQDVKEKLLAANTEYEKIQQPGIQLPSQSIKTTNPFKALSSSEPEEGPSSPTKLKQPELAAELAEESELKPTKLEKLLDETKIIDEAIAESRLERLHSAEGTFEKSEIIELPFFVNVPSLPEKKSTSKKDIYYVEFLSEQNYRICDNILSQSPDNSDLLIILSELFKTSGTIKTKKKFEKHVEDQKQILYAVIYWFIHTHTKYTGKEKLLPFDIANIYWLLYIINAFKNVTPSCMISDLTFVFYRDIDKQLDYIYNSLRIYCSYFSKNMLSMIPHRLDISFGTYKYLFETFNTLFQDFNLGGADFIKSMLTKCLINMQIIPQSVEIFDLPNILLSVYTIDESLSISKTPPLFHTSMDEIQQSTYMEMVALQDYIAQTSDTREMVTHMRDVILNKYILGLIEHSVRELNELIERKELNTVFIRKIILIFYNLIFTSRPPNNYIFDINKFRGNTHIKNFIKSLFKILNLLKQKLTDDDMHHMFNQLYVFITIYFPPMMHGVFDPTFIKTSNYIFDHDL